LAYLELPNLMKATASPDNHQYCSACFDGKYPIALNKPEDSNVYELPTRQVQTKGAA
jgi:glutamine phosphoribosylpyrophosphate amidotransferase